MISCQIDVKYRNIEKGGKKGKPKWEYVSKWIYLSVMPYILSFKLENKSKINASIDEMI